MCENFSGEVVSLCMTVCEYLSIHVSECEYQRVAPGYQCVCLFYFQGIASNGLVWYSEWYSYLGVICVYMCVRIRMVHLYLVWCCEVLRVVVVLVPGGVPWSDANAFISHHRRQGYRVESHLMMGEGISGTGRECGGIGEQEGIRRDDGAVGGRYESQQVGILIITDLSKREGKWLVLVRALITTKANQLVFVRAFVFFRALVRLLVRQLVLVLVFVLILGWRLWVDGDPHTLAALLATACATIPQNATGTDVDVGVGVAAIGKLVGVHYAPVIVVGGCAFIT